MNLRFFSDSDSWRYTVEKQALTLRPTNEEVASCVACGCRMNLYVNLDKLGERILYCDTHSVIYMLIFMQLTDEPPLIECGDPIGNMTSRQIANEYISEFVSSGPKNYAYKLCNSVTGK